MKVSELTTLTGAATENTDLLMVVDLSAGTAGSKSITVAELFATTAATTTATTAAQLPANVQTALEADPAGARNALGIPTYSTLELANAALANGDLFYNSISGKYETATA